MKKISLLALCAMSCGIAYAQRLVEPHYTEVTIGIGAMNTTGDIARKLYLPSSKTDLTVGIGRMFNNTLGIRLQLTAGNIEGSDRNYADTFTSRNLSFKSPVTEVSVLSEFHPLMIKGWKKDVSPKWSPYLIAGIAVLKYRPQAYINDLWVSLQPLRTEGQGRPYSLTSVALPIGLGIKKEISDRFNIRLEGIYRFTSTDHLDDVSENYADPASFDKHLHPILADLARQLYNRADPGNERYRSGKMRGDPKYNDRYFTLNITFGYCPFRIRFKD